MSTDREIHMEQTYWETGIRIQGCVTSTHIRTKVHDIHTCTVEGRDLFRALVAYLPGFAWRCVLSHLYRLRWRPGQHSPVIGLEGVPCGSQQMRW